MKRHQAYKQCLMELVLCSMLKADIINRTQYLYTRQSLVPSDVLGTWTWLYGELLSLMPGGSHGHGRTWWAVQCVREQRFLVAYQKLLSFLSEAYKTNRCGKQQGYIIWGISTDLCRETVAVVDRFNTQCYMPWKKLTQHMVLQYLRLKQDMETWLSRVLSTFRAWHNKYH